MKTKLKFLLLAASLLVRINGLAQNPVTNFPGGNPFTNKFNTASVPLSSLVVTNALGTNDLFPVSSWLGGTNFITRNVNMPTMRSTLSIGNTNALTLDQQIALNHALTNVTAAAVNSAVPGLLTNGQSAVTLNSPNIVGNLTNRVAFATNATSATIASNVVAGVSATNINLYGGSGFLFSKRVLYASQCGCALNYTNLTGTDDSQIINSNLATLSALGGGTWVQDGISFLTNTILVPSKVKIYGTHDGDGFFWATNSSFLPILATAGYLTQTIVSNIVIDGITFYANAEHSRHGTGYNFSEFLGGGIMLSACRDVLVENSKLIHNPNFGFIVNNFNNVRFSNVSQKNTNCVFGVDLVHIWGPGTNIVLRDIFGQTGDDVVSLNVDEVMGAGRLNGYSTNFPYVTWGAVDGVTMDNIVCNPVDNPLIANAGYDPFYFAGEGVRILDLTNRLDHVSIHGLHGKVLFDAVNCSLFFASDFNYIGNIGSLTIDNVDVATYRNGQGQYGLNNSEPNPSVSYLAFDSKIDDLRLSNVSSVNVLDSRPIYYLGASARIGDLHIDGAKYYRLGNSAVMRRDLKFTTATNRLQRLTMTNLATGSLVWQADTTNLWYLIQGSQPNIDASWMGMGKYSLPLLPSLEAQWKFDQKTALGTYSDSSGQGHDLLPFSNGYQGGNALGSTSGVSSNAVYFNGGDYLSQWLTIPPTSDFSLSLWLMSTNPYPAANKVLFEAWTTGFTNYPHFQIFLNTAGLLNLSGSDTLPAVSMGVYPITNSWSHWVFRYNHNTGLFRSSLNGTNLNSYSGRYVTSDLNQWYFGGSFNSYSQPNTNYTFAIDQANLFAKELSDAEVMMLYTNPTATLIDTPSTNAVVLTP